VNLLDALLPPDAGPAGQLAIYLNDHRAGAEGAEALANRCARSNADNAVGHDLFTRADDQIVRLTALHQWTSEHAFPDDTP